MNDNRLRSHTITSHGFTLTRTHYHDWLILILLASLEGILYIIPNFRRFIGKDMMTDLKYPLESSTVPFWSVPIYAVLLPIVIFLVIYWRRRDVYDLHHAILGILFSVFVTGFITESLKDAVGRPRPDFFWRCFPDGKDVYDLLGNVKCHGEKHIVKEGYKSFPSGHTSWSFAGLGFLSLYSSGKVRAFDQRGNVAKLCIVIFPLLIACLVGISLIDDYWHHWEDVFAGGLIGIVVTILCYLHFFPPPYHPEGWAPYAFFRAREVVSLSHATRETNSGDQDGPDIEAQAENEGVDENRSRNHIVLELAST